MELVWRDDLKDVEWERIATIFQEVGWGDRDPGEIRAAFEKSAHIRIVRDNGEIIAFGRSVDDGRYYALIVDLVVAPSHQRRGIGKKMLAQLEQEMKGYNFVTLTAAPGKEDFYLKQGWKRQHSAFI